MPQCKRPPVSRDADHISALPDVLLHQILGLLQAREAVQTCVLARRWRNLWKSMPVLRVTGASPVKWLQEFMDYILLLRDRSAGLDVCVFEFGAYLAAHVSYVNLWIRHALLLQVRELDVAVFGSGRMVNELELDNLPVVSQSLTKLKLRGLILDHKFLNFSSCPALKDLNLTNCNIFGTKISSQSLECLGIQDCKFLWEDCRTHISAPSLVSLKINGCWGLTPSFEEMPMLVRATVELGQDCFDSCHGGCDEASCWNCHGTGDGSAGCVLLKSLSAARSLELIAEPKTFIFNRDLRWCPTFSKLRTLLLTEWCMTGERCALICILQHSPALEMLTLQLSKLPEAKPKNFVSSKQMYNWVDQSFPSESVKTVKVKCYNIDERVHNILKSLTTYGIPLQKISIQQENELSQLLTWNLPAPILSFNIQL